MADNPNLKTLEELESATLEGPCCPNPYIPHTLAHDVVSLIKGLHVGFVRSVDSLRLHQNLVVAQDMMLQALPGSIEYAAGAGTVKELRDQIDDVSGEG